MDDKNEILNQSPENEEPEVKFETEGSTIFVKHEYNTKKPTENGWKKRIGIAAVAVVLCVVIGLGAFFIVRKVPVDSPDNTQSVTVNDYIPVVTFADKATDDNGQVGVMVGDKLLTDNVNITGAGIYNYYEHYSIMPYTEEDKNGTVTKWYIPGIDKDQVLSDNLYDHIVNCLNIYATVKMENKYSSLEEYHKAYGVDSENCSRAFVANFGEGDQKVELEILVGMQVAAGNGNYLRVVGDDTVYIVPAEYIANYDYLPSNFADLNMLTKIKETSSNTKYFTANKLSRFDYIKISGKVLDGKTYNFGMSTDVSADYMPYIMTFPYRRPASEAFLENILKFASEGITAEGIYSFSATKENMKTCGLDDPKCVIEAKIGEYYFKLTIGGLVNEDSPGLTAMINGKKQIFCINTESMDFVDPEITSMFNQNFIMENIIEIDSVTFEANSGKHTFDLTHTPLESNKDAYDTTVKYKGKTADITSFKSLYKRVLLLSLLSFVIEEERIEPELTITFKYIGDYKDRVVEFTTSPRDNYHYVAWIDGVPLGEVLKTSVNDITDNLEIYVKGGNVKEPL